ncbi:hypothetical protein Pcinc_011161 [Petrolisthes cinctipes]|uniref:Uncharacterized protein n=1 Tax=Petrolisthes cinctipes TaxID=88211 RepID=A0AAE1G7G1_PETCI|nr:hypothetical protein Pcinc_011161 [Petrolisthes cinctipes]
MEISVLVVNGRWKRLYYVEGSQDAVRKYPGWGLPSCWLEDFIQAMLDHRLKKQSEYPSDIMLTEVSTTSKPRDQLVKCECTEVMLQVWIVMEPSGVAEQ